MYSMFTTPSASLEPTGFDVAGIAISLGAGILLWLVATFVISRITKRVASGTTSVQEAALPVGRSRPARPGP